MVLFLMTAELAAADPTLPDGYGPVELAATPLVFEGAGWLRTPVGCRAVEASGGQLEAHVCEVDGATCTWSTELGDTWLPYGLTMCQRPDGTGWGGGGGASMHGAPQRVASAPDRVVWRPVVELRAAATSLRRDVNPCTAETADHDGAHVHDGERWCEQAGGSTVRVVPLQTGLPGVGIGVLTHEELVDCTVPCAVDPVLEKIREANGALDGRLFAAEDGPRVELFRSQQDCEASPHPSAVVFDLGACEGPDE